MHNFNVWYCRSLRYLYKFALTCTQLNFSNGQTLSRCFLVHSLNRTKSSWLDWSQAINLFPFASPPTTKSRNLKFIRFIKNFEIEAKKMILCRVIQNIHQIFFSNFKKVCSLTPTYLLTLANLNNYVLVCKINLYQQILLVLHVSLIR